MTPYKHTQIGYLMLVVFLVVLVLFVQAQIAARAEPPSVDSGANLLVTSVMALVLFTLASFITLTVTIDDMTLKVKFGYGLFRKTLSLGEIASAKAVRISSS